jgi:L-threonate 2-dehydrogenase
LDVARRVIGLGSMGMGMARALRRAGFDVVGCDADPAAVEQFVREGGRGGHAAQTEAVLFGETV